MTSASTTLVADAPRAAEQGTAPRRTPTGRQQTRPAGAARRTAAPRPVELAAARTRLLPFAVLVLVLLAGGLVAMLLLNTALAQGAFRLAALQKTAATLSDQQQQLQAVLAREQSTDVLAARAKRLGMQDTCSPHFLVLSTGRTYGEACSATSAPAASSGGAPAATPTPSAASSARSASAASPAPTTASTTSTRASGSR